MNTQSVFEHASRVNDNSLMAIVFLVWLLHVLLDNERLAGVNFITAYLVPRIFLPSLFKRPLNESSRSVAWQISVS